MYRLPLRNHRLLKRSTAASPNWALSFSISAWRSAPGATYSDTVTLIASHMNIEGVSASMMRVVDMPDTR